MIADQSAGNAGRDGSACLQASRERRIVLIGQPNVEERKIDNPLIVPECAQLSDLSRWKAEVQGARRISLR